MTLNGKASSGSTSIAVGNPKPRVQAGPFTFSINRVFAQNAKGRPQSAFKVGQRVFVVADFTVRNLRSSLGASISVTFQARVGGGWKAVQPPNTYDLPAIRNGLNRYRQSFAIQSAAYSPLRILVGVTIASSYHQGMTTITVRK